MDLRSQLLEWITSDSEELRQRGKPPCIPIHLLLVKLALARKAETGDSSASTELSLQVFERSQLFRTVRDLVQQGSLRFVDATGETLSVSERDLQLFSNGEPSTIKFVALG